MDSSAMHEGAESVPVVPAENMNRHKGPTLHYMALDVESYEVRILTISPDTEESPIRCVLTRKSLIEPGNYVALSYCWGDSGLLAKVTVNGIETEVTVNLRNALWHLRAIGVYRIWADAICINQCDRQERSSQVSLMKKIYSKAKRVVSFIGADVGDIERILELARQLPSHYSKAWWELRGLTKGSINQPYWNRVWIMQEVSVASSVTVLCGRFEIDWKRLMDIIDPFPYYGNFKAVRDFRTAYQKGERISLIEAMDESRESISTEPRDKIYALLGLCHDGDALVPYPNYKQPIEEISRDLTRAAMKSKGSLEYLFTRTAQPLPSHELPSWAIDWVGLWSNKESLWPSKYLDRHRRFAIADWPDPNILMVRGEVIGSITSILDHGTWSSTSSRASRALGRTMREYYGSNSEVANAIGSILRLRRSCSAGQDETVLKSFFSTLWDKNGRIRQQRIEQIVNYFLKDSVSWVPLGLRFVNDNPASPAALETRHQERAMKHFISFHQLLLEIKEVGVAGKTIQGWVDATEEPVLPVRHLESPAAIKNKELDLIGSLSGIAENEMKLVVVEQRILAMAHSQVRAADKVCLLGGLKDPILLREVADDIGGITYKVVGGIFLGLSKRDPLYLSGYESFKLRHWLHIA